MTDEGVRLRWTTGTLDGSVILDLVGSEEDAGSCSISNTLKSCKLNWFLQTWSQPKRTLPRALVFASRPSKLAYYDR